MTNLEKLMEKATPLPWRTARSHEDGDGPMYEIDADETLPPITWICGADKTQVTAAHDLFVFKPDNAALLTHAVNMLPRLVKALENVANATDETEELASRIHARAVLKEVNNPK